MDATAAAAVTKRAFEDLASGFASVLEAMAGVRPDVSWGALPSQPETTRMLGWKQPLPPFSNCVYTYLTEADAMAAGEHVMQAAGIDDCSPSELKSTFFEAQGQVLSVFARGVTARLGQEITPKDGEATSDAPAEAHWASIRLTFSGKAILVYAALPGPLLEEIAPPLPMAAVAAQDAGANSPGGLPAPSAPPTRGAADDSKTFDLLLEVELPLSVSFGRAQVPLKDVLKLTTGSIVELSRAVVEPVDIIVNNCVIARGEVVVVEGNFGVRIQHVVSRHERLRTLR